MRSHIHLATLLMTLLSQPIGAQTIESAATLPTDGVAAQIFHLNPAMISTEDLVFGYAQYNRNKEVKAEYYWSDAFRGDATIDVKETVQSLGFAASLAPGMAVGLTGTQVEREQSADLDVTSRVVDEDFKAIEGAGRLILDITNSLQAAINLRYKQIDNDVYGRFFLPSSDITKYKGDMTGFSAGVWYQEPDWNIGAAYYSALRGKAKLRSEEIIIAEPGRIYLHGVYGKVGEWTIGASIQRWSYINDDRTKPAQSLEEEEDISLNGADFEHHLFTTDETSVGVDTPYLFNHLYLKLAVTKVDSVFLFEDDQIPGDDGSDETAFSHYRGDATLAFSKAPFNVHLTYSYATRDKSTVEDREWFTQEYRDYEAKETNLILSLNYSD